jgi:hypothetical protein
MRDPTAPAGVRVACHIDGPAAVRAGIPGECPLDTEVDNQPDTPVAVHAGQTAGQNADPFVDQTRCSRVPRSDYQGRGEPRCSMGMRVVAARPAEVRMAGESLRGLTRRPISVLENR